MRQLFAGLFGLAWIITVGSCEKDDTVLTENEQEETSAMTAEDETMVEHLMEYTEGLEEEVMEFRTVDTPCVEVSWLHPGGSFPNTVTIDFGDGCMGPDGHLRAGKIIIHQSAPMSDSGAVRETTFVDFSIESIEMEGSKTLTNNGRNTHGHPSFTSGSNTRVADIELIFPDGSVVSRYSEVTRTKIHGAPTLNRRDDVFAITGQASGTNRAGVAYEAVITEPLIKPHVCRWIIDGTLELSRDGSVSTVDYGFRGDSCDRVALVTFADGSSKIMRIHKRWW